MLLRCRACLTCTRPWVQFQNQNQKTVGEGGPNSTILFFSSNWGWGRFLCSQGWHNMDEERRLTVTILNLPGFDAPSSFLLYYGCLLVLCLGEVEGFAEP